VERERDFSKSFRWIFASTPVAVPAVIRDGQPLHIAASEGDRSLLSVEILGGFPLPNAQPVGIEIPRNILASPVKDVLNAHLQGVRERMLVLIVLISYAQVNPSGGNILQCYQFMTQNPVHHNGMAFSQVPADDRSRIKRGPTKTVSFTTRSARFHWKLWPAVASRQVTGGAKLVLG
jgi:hypothetical protein